MHNNEIVFTHQSTMSAFSTQQKETKHIMKQHNYNYNNIVDNKSDN